jgi:hypothetical protein
MLVVVVSTNFVVFKSLPTFGRGAGVIFQIDWERVLSDRLIPENYSATSIDISLLPFWSKFDGGRLVE